MKEENPFSPQLFMRRKNLEGLPVLETPQGFSLRHYEEGDENEWEKLIKATFNFDMDFKKEIKEKPFFNNERIFFICSNNIPVATATAWRYDKNPDKTGYVHMVAAYPDYKGKRLGYYVSLAALHRMKYEGCEDVVLETDDFRLPAISVYVKLGFEPEYTHDNQIKRWDDIFAQLKSKK